MTLKALNWASLDIKQIRNILLHKFVRHNENVNKSYIQNS